MTTHGILKIIGGVIGFLVFAGIIYSVAYWYSPHYDHDCLINYAREFCLEQNLTFRENSVGEYSNCDFVCDGERDERLKIINARGFYFLDSEKENCQIKPGRSFK